MRQNVRIGKIDDFKWLAAFLVAAIHTSPLESVNATADFILTRVLARVAVPFFMMVTGFFVLYGAVEEGSFGRIGHSLKKLGLLYLAVTLLYLPVQVYRLAGGEWELSAGALGRAVFFDGTYYHLWYLPAVMIGLPICFLLLRIMGSYAYAAAAVLYVIGLFGDSYNGFIAKIPMLGKIYDGIFHISSQTRNGLFFAPLFLLLGYRAAVLRKESSVKKSRRIFYLSLCLMCAEGLWLHLGTKQEHNSMYLLLPVCMTALFDVLLTGAAVWDVRRGTFYKKGPMLFYFLHPMMILIVRAFAKLTKLNFILEVSPVYYLAVAAGSLCAAYICLKAGQYVLGIRKGRKNK